ncbi:mCG145219, partial [Mus musculus]
AGLGLPSYCPENKEEVLNAGRRSGNLRQTLWWRWRPRAPELLTLPVRAIGPFPACDIIIPAITKTVNLDAIKRENSTHLWKFKILNM